MSYTQDPYGMLLRYMARDHRLRQRQARIPDIMCRALRRSLVRRGRLQRLPTRLEVTVRFSLNEWPPIPYGEFIISLWRPDLMVVLPTVDTGRFIRPAEDRGVMDEVLLLAHRIGGVASVTAYGCRSWRCGSSRWSRFGRC